jgi:D-tyrosyl-tRNA(Tyr) deacylase
MRYLIRVRAVVQRVTEATVTVGDETVGAIGAGLAILLGVKESDTPEDARYLAEKSANLRVFGDDQGRMNRSLLETRGRALVVSQFTLLGDARRGRRPSYAEAAPPELAESLYLLYCRLLQEQGITVATGRFGAMMRVHLVNDGPVTLLLDSERHF